MQWCLQATEGSGQAHHSSQGLLLGQGSIACPLVTHHYIPLSQTLIHHVQEPVSVTVILLMQQTSTAVFALHLFLFHYLLLLSF